MTPESASAFTPLTRQFAGRLIPLRAGKEAPTKSTWKRWPKGLDRAKSDHDAVEHVRNGGNIGVRTGHGLIVVEFDIDEAEKALITNARADERRRLQAKYSALVDDRVHHFCTLHKIGSTLSSRAPSGGVHLYLRLPEDSEIPDTLASLDDRLDVRAEGGYVVAPPSVVDDGNYTWIDQGAPLEPCSASLIQALLRSTAHRRIRNRPRPSPSAHDLASLDVELEKQCALVTEAEVGMLDRTLKRSAFIVGRLVGAGLDAERGRNALLDAVSRQVGASPRDCVIEKIGRAMTDGAKKPWRINRGPDGTTDENSSQADQLVVIARERFEFARAKDQRLYAIERRERVAHSLRSNNEHLRTLLANAFSVRTGRVPSGSAITDALTVLRGEAAQSEPIDVHVRIADIDGRTVIHRGSLDGSAIEIGADGWKVMPPRIAFRHSNLAAEIPIPVPGGSLNEWRHLVNVNDETWKLLLGFLTSALIREIPHPIVLINGMQGLGKSTLARMIVGLLDPSPVDIRSFPSREDDWMIGASLSWVNAFDNVSTIRPWLSDVLCRAISGSGTITRQRYTDDTPFPVYVRSVILITSIEPGSLRGDLAERLLFLDAEPIQDPKRRSEESILREFEDRRPRIFGALLDLLVKVRAVLPEVPAAPVRMSDFGRVLMAVDRATGWSTFETYQQQVLRAAEAVVEDDLVARQLLKLSAKERRWTGTWEELRLKAQPDGEDRESWPKNPRNFSGRLRRVAPALQKHGMHFDLREKKVHRPEAQGSVKVIRYWRDEPQLDQRVDTPTFPNDCRADAPGRRVDRVDRVDRDRTSETLEESPQ